MKSIQFILVMLICSLAYAQEDTTSEAITISPVAFIDTNTLIYPPELIISIPPPIIDWGWISWGPTTCVFIMPEREADNAKRIFAYAESPALAFESVQVGDEISTRFEAKEDQVITLRLSKLGDEREKVMAYHYLSIPIKIRKGLYEFSSKFKSMWNATYLLSIDTKSGTEVSRIETSSKGDPHPYQSKIKTNNAEVVENVKIIHL